MPNGTGLTGGQNSTQCLISPAPADANKYYIFTVDEEVPGTNGQTAGPDGLRYSVIDLTKNNGKGDVILKNILLETPVCEKIAFAVHENEKDIWIISHKWKSSDLIAYLITEDGINTKPVVSTIGDYQGETMNGRPEGYLKISPDGKRLANIVVSPPKSKCQVFDFDNATGKITNPFSIFSAIRTIIPYGVEFSPNSKLLYISCQSHWTLQYNLSISDTSLIDKSYVVIRPDNVNDPHGALQLGTDGKIYVATHQKTTLGVINYPDSVGTACNYEPEAIDLKGKKVHAGLPPVIVYGDTSANFTYTNACLGDSIKFYGTCSVIPDSWEWSFDNGFSGYQFLSDQQNPVYLFSQKGAYKVRLITSVNNRKDTVEENILVLENPVANLGKDTVFCNETETVLNAGTEAQEYLWSTNETGRAITIKKSGTYWVQAKNASCISTDTIKIGFFSTEARLGNDTVICSKTEFWLKSKISNAENTWSTGSQQDSIKITETGLYWLHVKAGSCETTDSVFVTVLPEPTINFDKELMLCEGDSMVFDAKNPGAQYLWSTAETSQFITVKKAGKYWLTINIGECSVSDTIIIKNCSPIIHIPNAFSPNNDGVNDTFRVYGSDIESISLSVYNRWGECVFETNNLQAGWDGKFKNYDSPVESYFWVLKYRGREAAEADYKMLSGVVNLVR